MPEEAGARERILAAAFSAFTEGGYDQASTLDIATRAQVSKRALYSLVGNKQDLLIACISERAKRLSPPADMPRPNDLATLSHILVRFGTRVLTEVSDPAVTAVFRLAIGEAIRAPEVAKTLDTVAYRPTRNVLKDIMTQAKAAGLLEGAPPDIADQFAALLWGDIQLRLLMRTTERPSEREIARRAGEATRAILTLHAKGGAQGQASHE